MNYVLVKLNALLQEVFAGVLLLLQYCFILFYFTNSVNNKYTSYIILVMYKTRLIKSSSFYMHCK